MCKTETHGDFPVDEAGGVEPGGLHVGLQSIRMRAGGQRGAVYHPDHCARHHVELRHLPVPPDSQ